MGPNHIAKLNFHQARGIARIFHVSRDDSLYLRAITQFSFFLALIQDVECFIRQNVELSSPIEELREQMAQRGQRCQRARFQLFDNR